jgi:ribonuclease D
LPRGWIADNEVLIALAKSQPKSIDELKTFRGIHTREIDKSGKNILEAIEKGKLSAPKNLPEVKMEIPRIDPHAANLIQTYITFLASKNQIMPRYLMNNNQANLILSHLDKTPSDWVSLGILSHWAARLIGDDLVALFRGSRALRIKNKKLSIIEVDV